MSAREGKGVPAWVVGVAAAAAVVVVFGVAFLLNRVVHEAPASGHSAAATATEPAASPSASSGVPTSKPDEAAAGFVAAFTDHQVPVDVWERTYSAYLTDRAKTAYEGTDRTQVPGTRVTGKATVTAGVSAAPVPGSADDDGDADPVPAIVTVPTDAGTYTVNLQQQAGRWLVVSAQLPGSDQ